MLRSIKRSLSGGNLSSPRVRFSAESKPPASLGGSTVSMEGDTLEASTMGGDTISSDSSDSDDTMSNPLEDPPGCTKGDQVDFLGVATESIRALAMSAWLVSETVAAIGTEIVRMPRHCGLDNSVDTDTRVAADGSRGRLGGGRNKSAGDDSSEASYPNSKQKRRKRPFGLFGLGNRAKKNLQESRPPATVTTTNRPPSPTLLKKVPPKTPAPKKPSTPIRAIMCTSKREQPLDDFTTTSKESKPARAKKLLTACFVKKPDLDLDDDSLTLQSRYRTEHEDFQLMGTSTVYTIRMSRVPTSEYDNL